MGLAVPGPDGLRRALLDGGMALGRRLAGVRGPLAPLRRGAVEEIFANGELTTACNERQAAVHWQNGAMNLEPGSHLTDNWTCCIADLQFLAPLQAVWVHYWTVLLDWDRACWNLSR